MSRKDNPFDMAREALNDDNAPYSNAELTKVSAISEGIKQLQNFKNIFGVTDLSPDMVVLFSKARAIADFWDIPEINEILEGLAILRLSKDRKSREEILKALIGLSGKKPDGKKIRITTTGED